MTDQPPARPSPSTPPDLALDRGAIGALRAGEAVVSVGAIGAARADRVSVEFGAIGAAAAREIQVGPGAVGLLVAREARVEQAFVRTAIARHLTLGRGSAAAVVLALHADGDGRPLLDWRGGLAAGTIVGLVWLLLRRLR
jgi:hypothetical protein